MTRESCQAKVYVRDTYRYIGGYRVGIDYQYRTCRRLAQTAGFCWQHQGLGTKEKKA